LRVTRKAAAFASSSPHFDFNRTSKMVVEIGAVDGVRKQSYGDFFKKINGSKENQHEVKA
jgi:hypothetical protein